MHFVMVHKHRFDSLEIEFVLPTEKRCSSEEGDQIAGRGAPVGTIDLAGGSVHIKRR